MGQRLNGNSHFRRGTYSSYKLCSALCLGNISSGFISLSDRGEWKKNLPVGLCLMKNIFCPNSSSVYTPQKNFTHAPNNNSVRIAINETERFFCALVISYNVVFRSMLPVNAFFFKWHKPIGLALTHSYAIFAQNALVIKKARHSAVPFVINFISINLIKTTSFPLRS